MLTRFSVKNYMGFPDAVTWDLSHPRDYTFNAHLIKDGVVKNGIIYGINGSGKTSLGRAVFDIVSLDEAAKVDYSKIIYQGNTDAPIDFEYEFKFDGNCSVMYSYSRNNRGTLLRECLALNGVLVFDKDDNEDFNEAIQLAEKAGLSRSLISLIEAPGITKNFTLDAFYSIADALAVDPAELIHAAVFPDALLGQK